MNLSDLTDPDAVLAAIEEFDDIGREAFLEKYGYGPSKKYFLIHEGKRYDSKAIVGAAYGKQYPHAGPLTSAQFSGGEATVAPLLQKLGFRVTSNTEDDTPHMDFQAALQQTLDGYLSSRQEPFGADHPMWQLFNSIEERLRRHPAVTRSRIQVSASVGQGNWARVPWIALLSRSETTSIQNGVYVVFLFRQDMSGVYLTFNQGVTELRKKRRKP